MINVHKNLKINAIVLICIYYFLLDFFQHMVSNTNAMNNNGHMVRITEHRQSYALFFKKTTTHVQNSRSLGIL